MSPINPNLILCGVLLIIATALMISVQDLVFKLFTGELTLWQIFSLRGIMAVPVLVAICFASTRSITSVRLAFTLWPLFRALCITMTFLAFYAAIPFLSLSTVGAANYTAPIFVAILSAYVIKEPVGLWGWIGVALGFLGVVILLQPGTDAFSVFSLLPIAGAAFYSIGHIITRTHCQGIATEVLSLSQNTTMLFVGVLISAALLFFSPDNTASREFPYLLGQWSTVGIKDWMVLALLAVFAIVLGIMLARAYQIAPPATIATFEYSYLIFVAGWDILFFGLPPTVPTLIGIIFIVGAGLIVMQSRSN
ncbi:MAG: DMT family transporter [Pseudomonadota bacterium]